MAIPTNDFLVKPYDDEKMIYNYDLRQYVLQRDWAIHRTGLGDLINDLGGNVDNVDWFLEWVSITVYNYIRSFKDSKFQKRLTYYLSHSREMRDALERLMVDSVFYSEQEGGLFTAYITGVNLQEAKNITNLSLKTAVGIIGDQIVANLGLKEREFRYDFDVVESTLGLEW